MKKSLLTSGALLLLLNAAAVAQPTPLNGDHIVNGSLTVGTAASPRNLEVKGYTYPNNGLIFSNQVSSANTWQLSNNGGTMQFFPGGITTLGASFRNDGSVSFANIVSIGDVGIAGTGTLRLAVGGGIGARGFYVRAQGVAWPDYVFQASYRLRPLKEVGQFVRANGHLPEVPSAATVQAEGIELGSMNALLLKKVEELTLYLLAMQQENEALKERVRKLEN